MVGQNVCTQASRETERPACSPAEQRVTTPLSLLLLSHLIFLFLHNLLRVCPHNDVAIRKTTIGSDVARCGLKFLPPGLPL